MLRDPSKTMTKGADDVDIGVSVNYLTQDYELRDTIDGARRAEALGLDAVWVHDAPLGRRTMAAWDPVTILSAVGAATEEIKLCTGIIQPQLRNPIELAKLWATMHELSAERSIFGVGTGAGVERLVDREYEAIAVLGGGDGEELYRRRGSLYEESLEVIKRLWEEDKISYDGELYEFDDITLGTARPENRPPILMGQGIYFPEEPGGPVHHGWSEKRAGQYVLGPYERVARLGDGWITATATPEDFAEGWRKIEAELRDLGRDPEAFTTAINCFVNVNESEERAHEEIKRYLEKFHGPPIHDDVVDQWGVGGPPDRVADQLDEYAQHGGSLFQLILASTDQFEQMERFADEVLPLL